MQAKEGPALESKIYAAATGFPKSCSQAVLSTKILTTCGRAPHKTMALFQHQVRCSKLQLAKPVSGDMRDEAETTFSFAGSQRPNSTDPASLKYFQGHTKATVTFGDRLSLPTTSKWWNRNPQLSSIQVPPLTLSLEVSTNGD